MHCPRTDEIVYPVLINYSELADKQMVDDDLQNFFNDSKKTNLKLKLLFFEHLKAKLYCDVSQMMSGYLFLQSLVA